MANKEYMKDHWSFLAYWIKHGGPHLVWILGLLGALYSAGFVDVPAWSKDVKAVDNRVASIAKKTDDTAKKVEEIRRGSAAGKERDIAQQRQLNDIHKKLDLIIQNLFTHPKL